MTLQPSVALALAALAAGGVPERPLDTYPELADMIPVARAAWPDSPCRGRETLEIRQLGHLDDGTKIGGQAWPDDCRVALDYAVLANDYSACVVLTHELGHLAGHDHSDDERSIMYRTWWGRDFYWPCYEVLRRTLDRIDAAKARAAWERRQARRAARKAGRR